VLAELEYGRGSEGQDRRVVIYRVGLAERPYWVADGGKRG
jgi:ABC-type transport system involved in cytochrome c biogenesis ATPase subunit